MNGLKDIVDFIESRFIVRVRMLLHGDEILYSEGSEMEPPREELRIKIHRHGLAKVGVAAAAPRIPNTNISHRLREKHSGREFFDLRCYCVDSNGDDVDLPRVRLLARL